MRKHLKKTTKRAILASSMAGIAAVSIVATSGYAQAHRGYQDRPNNRTKAEVQQNRAEDRQKHLEQRLERLVSEGKLTQAQADKIKAKLEAMKPKLEAAHKETDPEKRKAAHEAIKDELEQWAKDNTIDMSLVRPPRGGHRMGMMHHGPTEANESPAN